MSREITEPGFRALIALQAAYSECDEVADNMQPPRFSSFDEALAWVERTDGRSRPHGG